MENNLEKLKNNRILNTFIYCTCGVDFATNKQGQLFSHPQFVPLHSHKYGRMRTNITF
jgi:hypothetical protein